MEAQAGGSRASQLDRRLETSPCPFLDWQWCWTCLSLKSHAKHLQSSYGARQGRDQRVLGFSRRDAPHVRRTTPSRHDHITICVEDVPLLQPTLIRRYRSIHFNPHITAFPAPGPHCRFQCISNRPSGRCNRQAIHGRGRLPIIIPGVMHP
jgi:hypothetical protein